MSPSYWPEALAVLASPNTLSTHHLLAYKFWGSGYVSAAKREIQLAQISDNVLGVWESEPMRLSSEYSFWESVVREKPNYRDGFINLASLAYQLSKPDQAKEFLSQASRLDPNNEEVEKLFLFFGR